MNEQYCILCRWYDNFVGVCCNGESENRAEFMDGKDGCDKWEGTE